MLGETMTQEWQIDGPKVLDIGNEDETVGKLRLAMVGGRVEIVGGQTVTCLPACTCSTSIWCRFWWV